MGSPTGCSVNICLFQHDFSKGCRGSSAPASEALPPPFLTSFFVPFVSCVLLFLNQVFLETPPALLCPVAGQFWSQTGRSLTSSASEGCCLLQNPTMAVWDGVNFLHSSLCGILLTKLSLSQPTSFQHLFFDSFPHSSGGVGISEWLVAGLAAGQEQPTTKPGFCPTGSLRKTAAPSFCWVGNLCFMYR